MDSFDSLWNVRQDVGKLREHLDHVLGGWLVTDSDFQDTKEAVLRVVTKLAEENFELKLRLSLLVRLLIKNNLITAEDYAALIAEAQPTPSKRYFITDAQDPTPENH